MCSRFLRLVVPRFQSGVFRHWWCQLVGHRVVLIETLQPHHNPDMDNQNDNRADQVNATIKTYLKTQDTSDKDNFLILILLQCFFSDFHLLLFTLMLVFGCFHPFLGLLNECELVVRKLPCHQVFLKLMLSVPPTARSSARCWNTLLSPKTIPNKQTVSVLDVEAQLVARRVTIDERS